MEYLMISNVGEMEPEALTLFGASTKRDDDSTIGQFGSGNKYGPAHLMRNNIKFRVFSGMKEILVTTKTVNLRGKSFEQILVNGKETSLTTDAGPKWELWEAIREFYSNALDEGEAIMEKANEIVPKEGYTKFYIELTNNLRDVIINYNDYFAFKKPIIEKNQYGAILGKHDTDKTYFYRMNIKCGERKIPSLFDYNFKDVELTEDRRMRHSFIANKLAWKMLLGSQDKYIINKLFKGLDKDQRSSGTSIWETAFDSWNLHKSDISVEFENYLKSTVLFTGNMAGLLTEQEQLTTTLIPGDMFSWLMLNVPEMKIPESFSGRTRHDYTLIDETPLYKNTIKKVNEFFAECKFKQPYFIEFVEFQDKEKLGGADMKRKIILLSNHCIGQGIQQTAHTIFHEYCHIEYNVADASREMERSLIDMFITILKNLTAFNL